MIAFGRDAAVEVPPVRPTTASPAGSKALPDPEYTDLASAIQRAKALFPPNAAKRIVLLTDGNQNLGDAYREARGAADGGVSIDVVPVYLEPRDEVSIEKVDLPANIRRSQPFDMRVVLRNDAPEGSNDAIAGKLVVIRKVGPARRDRRRRGGDDSPRQAGPHDSAGNRPVRLLHLRGPLRPDRPRRRRHGAEQHRLGLHPHPRQGERPADRECRRPRAVRFPRRAAAQRKIWKSRSTATDNLFNSLAELQRYDAVILANVSRSSVSDADSGASFSDEQIEMLVRNTRELGCGLIMIGGPDSYGAGGWANTEARRGDAGRLPNQERRGRPGRRPLPDDARRRNGSRTTGKSGSPSSRSARWASATTAASSSGTASTRGSGASRRAA